MKLLCYNNNEDEKDDDSKNPSNIFFNSWFILDGDEEDGCYRLTDYRIAKMAKGNQTIADKLSALTFNKDIFLDFLTRHRFDGRFHRQEYSEVDQTSSASVICRRIFDPRHLMYQTTSLLEALLPVGFLMVARDDLFDLGAALFFVITPFVLVNTYNYKMIGLHPFSADSLVSIHDKLRVEKRQFIEEVTTKFTGEGDERLAIIIAKELLRQRDAGNILANVRFYIGLIVQAASSYTAVNILLLEDYSAAFVAMIGLFIGIVTAINYLFVNVLNIGEWMVQLESFAKCGEIPPICLYHVARSFSSIADHPAVFWFVTLLSGILLFFYLYGAAEELLELLGVEDYMEQSTDWRGLYLALISLASLFPPRLFMEFNIKKVLSVSLPTDRKSLVADLADTLLKEDYTFLRYCSYAAVGAAFALLFMSLGDDLLSPLVLQIVGAALFLLTSAVLFVIGECAGYKPQVVDFTENIITFNYIDTLFDTVKSLSVQLRSLVAILAAGLIAVGVIYDVRLLTFFPGVLFFIAGFSFIDQHKKILFCISQTLLYMAVSTAARSVIWNSLQEKLELTSLLSEKEVSTDKLGSYGYSFYVFILLVACAFSAHGDYPIDEQELTLEGDSVAEVPPPPSWYTRVSEFSQSMWRSSVISGSQSNGTASISSRDDSVILRPSEVELRPSSLTASES